MWPITADCMKSGPMRDWEKWQKEILRAVMEIGFLGNVVDHDIIHGRSCSPHRLGWTSDPMSNKIKLTNII